MLRSELKVGAKVKKTCFLNGEKVIVYGVITYITSNLDQHNQYINVKCSDDRVKERWYSYASWNLLPADYEIPPSDGMKSQADKEPKDPGDPVKELANDLISYFKSPRDCAARN